MSPEAIRKFWSLIEETQTNILLTLDNDALVIWLSRQLRREEFLKRLACLYQCAIASDPGFSPGAPSLSVSFHKLAQEEARTR